MSGTNILLYEINERIAHYNYRIHYEAANPNHLNLDIILEHKTQIIFPPHLICHCVVLNVLIYFAYFVCFRLVCLLYLLLII